MTSLILSTSNMTEKCGIAHPRFRKLESRKSLASVKITAKLVFRRAAV